jgi:hypothetical protein
MVRPRVEAAVNPDSLTVIVDDAAFERTRDIARKWDPTNFHAGTGDSVAFVDDIAASVGLRVPKKKVESPQDHIERLKKLNSKDSTWAGR